jgi:hypothetical protein
MTRYWPSVRPCAARFATAQDITELPINHLAQQPENGGAAPPAWPAGLAVDLAGNHSAASRAGTRSRSGRTGRAEVAVGDHAGRVPRVGNRRPAVTELENDTASQMQRRCVSERSPIPRFISSTSVLGPSGSAVNAVYGSRKAARAATSRRRASVVGWPMHR